MATCGVEKLPTILYIVALGSLMVAYLVICYLILDHIGENDDEEPPFPAESFSGLSYEELQEIGCFYYGAREEETPPLSSIIWCAICLDSLKEAELCRSFPAGCSHVFHAHCIDPWLLKTRTCPTCRSPYIYISPQPISFCLE
ncbi:unnamed protein product [Cuscuta epithymum]|uniref:RING-type domain-containing protein n=1 Tax=Cuscuta epithymum TaxID=186058 RepID=A0AAV0EB94_9ASTE|nr:unnamed protein product [Cuscuta epithymum]